MVGREVTMSKDSRKDGHKNMHGTPILANKDPLSVQATIKKDLREV